jgi:flagellar biosynthetic protein FliQ
MNGAEVLDVGRDAVLTMLKVSAPMLLAALLVGVVVSLIQALTQIQEMTLVFVPKIIAVFVVLILALPFMGDAMAAEMARLSALIAGGG